MSPVNRAYTDFLIATAYEEPFLTGLSAILPCFWVYLEVGKELMKHGSPNPPIVDGLKPTPRRVMRSW
jgi:thiaminase (transcriptional activator TenA)